MYLCEAGVFKHCGQQAECMDFLPLIAAKISFLGFLLLEHGFRWFALFFPHNARYSPPQPLNIGVLFTRKTPKDLLTLKVFHWLYNLPLALIVFSKVLYAKGSLVKTFKYEDRPTSGFLNVGTVLIWGWKLFGYGAILHTVDVYMSWSVNQRVVVNCV